MKSNLVGQLADRARSAALEYPPISRPEVAEVETRLGFSLPTTLHQIYSGIANGGFGPGYKIIGLVGGMPLDTGHSAVDIYEAFLRPDPEDPGWGWPQGLLPICHWGCGIYSCVECVVSGNPVVRFDPNGHGPGTPWGTAFEPEAPSLDDWLQRWLDDDLPFRPAK